MERFDVIVIGAGPAGSTASYLLAGAGMRVGLLDKCAFPRNKPCAGLLSERAEKVYKQIFGHGWQDLYESVSTGARFFYKNRLLTQVDGCRKMYFTNRLLFDHRLVMKAIAAGATFLEKTCAVSLDADRRTVHLGKGKSIRGDFVIGADGAVSRTAMSIGLSIDRSDLAIGLQAECPRGLRDLSLPEIHFGVMPWGYGWVFPKKESLTVGIAALRRKNTDLKNGLRTFMGQICHEPVDIRWQGHPIPFRNFRLRPGVENVLLVGDAAGLVEPVTGEGIAYAMQSAAHAAQAVVDAAGSGNPKLACEYYRERCQGLARRFKQAEKMRHLLFPMLFQKLFAKTVQKSKSPIYRYINLACGEIDYIDYLGFLLKGVAKHLISIW